MAEVVLDVPVVPTAAMEPCRSARSQFAVLEEVPEPSYHVQRIIDSGIVGVGYGHADGTISDVNDAFLKMIGHTREELLQGGLTWHQLTAPVRIPTLPATFSDHSPAAWSDDCPAAFSDH